jgi:hypothetical protein
MLDTDNDGVANYLDQEANTPAGTLVNTKGVSIQTTTTFQMKKIHHGELYKFN